MAINPTNLIPSFCRNCEHRFICSIQVNFRDNDSKVSEFNSANVPTQQSITSIGYVCRNKKIDTTVTP